jgi:pyruvate/2-oxoacid:ferredoxin oxidoreductase beta subunit
MNKTRMHSSYPGEECLIPPADGHSACPGCSIPLLLRYFLKATGGKVIMVLPPGCTLAIILFPSFSLFHQGQPISVLSTAFGSAAVCSSGLKAALEARGDAETDVVAWGGDGATHDIGLQGLSAAAERNDNIIYVCCDNEGYQNTGNQRSSATPLGAITSTTTAPTTKVERKKDIMQIMAGHSIPYAATATIAYPDDLMRKVRKAKEIEGFRFLHFLAPCVTGWKFPANLTVEVSRLAVQTNMFPLYEVENGTNITLRRMSESKPVEAYLGIQRRFQHLTSQQIAEIQRDVDRKWRRLEWLTNYKDNRH